MQYEELIITLNKKFLLTESEIINIKKYFVFASAKKKDIIFETNADCNKIYFIIKGIIRAYCINYKGDIVTRMIAAENCFLTNMVSLNNTGKNTEVFECLEETEYLYITTKNLILLFKHSAQLKDCYCDILDEQSTLQINHIHIITSSDASSKIKYLKGTFPNLIGRLSDQILASFIGITRETLGRNKKHLL